MINQAPALIYGNYYSGSTPWRLYNLKFCYGSSGFVAGDNNDVAVRDCQFVSDFSGVQSYYGKVLLTNVLFSACNPAVLMWSSQSVWAQNVTADGFTTFCSGASSLTLKDSLLTGSHVNDTGSLVNNHSVTGVSTSVFQSASQGTYFLDPNSAFVNQNLVDHGSQTASAAGLYYYTTRTDGAIEGNSLVDVGFHYFWDSADLDGNGVPDFLEDANNNGIPDYLETAMGFNPNVQNSLGNLNTTGYSIYLATPKGRSLLP